MGTSIIRGKERGLSKRGREEIVRKWEENQEILRQSETKFSESKTSTV